MNPFRKIVIAGGSGQLGEALIKHFNGKAERLIVLSRRETRQNALAKNVKWDGRKTGNWCAELEDADILINLTGKNINCRHNNRNKKEILDSRVDSVKVLAEAIGLCSKPPKLWVQASSAAIYDHRLHKPMAEHDEENGRGFLPDVCRAWEKALKEKAGSLKNTRQVVLRIGIVLGKNAGAFPLLKTLCKAGLGGKAGNGRQYMSWIHEEDFARMVEWIALNGQISGPVNAVSPQALSNAEFMKTLRAACGIGFGLPAPSVGIKLGAFIIGTEPSLVLDNLWAAPQKLVQSGFVFKYPDLSLAASNLIN